MAGKAVTHIDRKQSASQYKAGGLTGWLIARVLGRLRSDRRAAPRLALVERIALAPRQSVALIEAEGRRILVATSADGASAFYPLDAAQSAHRALPNRASRVSW
ncbi:MAG TPA: flagellar biosynthetic protein FliO [Terracidiphilus sp.]|nr:flagellar biosynthetic protein FliO [Terracidiphilus sp.]